MERIVRPYRVLTLMLLLGLVLAACGGTAGTGSSATSAAGTGATTAATTASGAATTAATEVMTSAATTEATTATAMSMTEEATAMAGTAMAGTAMAGTAMAGTEAAGTAMAGTAMAGTAMAGTAMAGTEAAGTAMAGTAAAGTAMAATGSTGRPKGTIAVGSKDFGEEFILGEMYSLLLENAGFTVQRKLNLGGTPIAQQALLNGDIDIYPEYTSTGLLTVLKQKQLQDPTQILQTVKSGYEQQFKLTWLDPAPFNDTQALAVTQETSQKYNITTYSELAQQAANLRIGGPAEFQEREDGIPGLQKAYGGFNFKEYVQLGTGSLRYQALQGGQVDVVVAFGTDGPIVANKLVVLKDDKGLYPIYQAAPVVRQDTLAANPEIATALNKLAPLLTDDVIQGLNLRVDVNGEDFAVVARDFLTEKGLISK